MISSCAVDPTGTDCANFTAEYNGCQDNNFVEFHSMVGAMYFLCVMQMFLNFLPTVIVFQG